MKWAGFRSGWSSSSGIQDLEARGCHYLQTTHKLYIAFFFGLGEDQEIEDLDYS
jgi:hypothetical protein